MLVANLLRTSHSSKTFYMHAFIQSHINSILQMRKLRPREAEELVQRNGLGVSSGDPALTTVLDLLCTQTHPFSGQGSCPERRGQGLESV